MERATIGGVNIFRPVYKLLLKFGAIADPQGDRWLPYDAYDGFRTTAELNGDHNSLHLDDLFCTVAMNSRVGGNAVNGLWRQYLNHRERRERVESLLRELPANAELAEATPKVVEQVEALFDVLQEVPGIGIAVAGKILARKRPGLIPMLDSVLVRIACFLHSSAGGAGTNRELSWNSGLLTDSRTALRQLAKLCRGGRAELESIRKRLIDTPEFRQVARHCEPTDLRILDSLLWFDFFEPPDQRVDDRISELRDRTGWEWNGQRWE